MEYGNLFKKRKGQVGLNTLLAIVSMLFMIGIIVMVYVIAGAKLQIAIAEDTSGSLTNETLSSISNTSYSDLSIVSEYTRISLSSILVTNATEGQLLDSNNYTVSGGSFQANIPDYDAAWNVTTNYAARKKTAAVEIINKSTQALSSVPEWFPTFIVLASLVVLILLVVIIINTIKGAGLTGSGGA